MATATITSNTTVDDHSAITPAWSTNGWTIGSVPTPLEADLDILLGKIWGVVCDQKQLEWKTSNEKKQTIRLVEEVEEEQQGVVSQLESLSLDCSHSQKRKRTEEVHKDEPSIHRRRLSDNIEVDLDFVNCQPLETLATAKPLVTKNTVIIPPAAPLQNGRWKRECRFCGATYDGLSQLADHLQCEKNFATPQQHLQQDDDDDEFEMEYVEYADAGCGRDDETEYTGDVDCGRWEDIEEKALKRRSCVSGYESPLETIGEIPEPEDEEDVRRLSMKMSQSFILATPATPTTAPVAVEAPIVVVAPSPVAIPKPCIATQPPSSEPTPLSSKPSATLVEVQHTPEVGVPTRRRTFLFMEKFTFRRRNHETPTPPGSPQASAATTAAPSTASRLGRLRLFRRNLERHQRWLAGC